MTEDEFQAALKSLTDKQLQFVQARMFAQSDIEAADKLHMSRNTVYNWSNKPLLDELVRHARLDGINITREKLRRAGPVAADTLVDVMQTARKPSDKTTAATAVLDRIGIGAKSSVEISGQIAVKAYVNVSPDDWDDEPATDGAPADAVGGSDETQQA